MPYGGKPTARETINAMLDDGRLAKLFDAADDEKSIMTALCIDRKTWMTLKKEIPAFSALSIRSRREKFYELKEAMTRNAKGYDYYEEYEELDSNGNVIKRTRTKRHKAPDLNSQKILIANIKKTETKNDGDMTIREWTNRAEEAIEIKTEGKVSLVLDAEIKSVLEAVGVN